MTTPKKGMIVLMGSGELTATMVELHKEIIARLGGSPAAYFLDTPAGFQLNADELSRRAVEYFRARVRYPLSVASFKSRDIPPVDAEKAFSSLREADYILVGPGSPTYAVKHWRGTAVPELMGKMIERGGCLVAASAASLTVGRFTLPVYEIYKVGEELFWAEGINILGMFGLDYVVVPHWNNAEGGTHDTRCCFVGEDRFRTLQAQLPEETAALGLDEHTACIIDFERNEVQIRGIGTMVVRRGDSQRVFGQGETFSLSVLKEGHADGLRQVPEHSPEQRPVPEGTEQVFWKTVHTIEETFHRGLQDNVKGSLNAILALDGIIWKAYQGLDDPESVVQARDLFRELIVLLGNRLATSPGSREQCIAPLVEKLLSLREQFRKNNQWSEADAVRDCLLSADIVVEDREEGSRWHFAR